MNPVDTIPRIVIDEGGAHESALLEGAERAGVPILLGTTWTVLDREDTVVSHAHAGELSVAEVDELVRLVADGRDAGGAKYLRHYCAPGRPMLRARLARLPKTAACATLTRTARVEWSFESR